MSAQLPWHRAQESCDCQACRDVKALARELNAAQQAAASLRQRLEMAQRQSDGDERVRQQLTQSVHFWMSKAEEAEARASQAEAALEEMRKQIRSEA